jgi:hypothetical protein
VFDYMRVEKCTRRSFKGVLVRKEEGREEEEEERECVCVCVCMCCDSVALCVCE